MAKKLALIFCISLVLNFIWEEIHSRLYVMYMHAPITHGVLLRAAFFDAGVILVSSFLYFFVAPFKKHLGRVVGALVIFAICLEVYALVTYRWEYNELMPIIPILGVGLTPVIQLGLIAYIAIRSSEKFKKTF